MERNDNASPIPRADTESILEAGKVWAGKAKPKRAQTKRRIKCTDGEDGVAPKNYILVRLYWRGR